MVGERERWVGGESGNWERGETRRGRDRIKKKKGGCIGKWEKLGRKEIREVVSRKGYPGGGGEGICRSVEGAILDTI